MTVQHLQPELYEQLVRSKSIGKTRTNASTVFGTTGTLHDRGVTRPSNVPAKVEISVDPAQQYFPTADELDQSMADTHNSIPKQHQGHASIANRVVATQEMMD
jgi:hypothetical protein